MNYHLITKQSGNTKKNRIVEVKYYEIFKNDIFSLNSKIIYNETNNDTESIDQFLMNLIANKNDNISYS